MSNYRPGPFAGGAADLTLYVQNELARVGDQLSVMRGGGTLYRNSLTGSPPGPVRTALPTFEKIVDWNTTAPARGPDGVAFDLAASSISIRRAGMWGLSVTLGLVGIATQREYAIAVFLSGAEIPLNAICDPSNQTTAYTFTMAGVFRVDQPTAGNTEVDIRIRTLDGINGPYQVQGGYFALWSVGD